MPRKMTNQYKALSAARNKVKATPRAALAAAVKVAAKPSAGSSLAAASRKKVTSALGKSRYR